MKVMFTLIFSCIVSFNVFPQTRDWELARNDEGIVIYTRNEPGSEFKSFKAEVVLEASTKDILQLLRHTEGYTEWFGYTASSRLLKQEGHVQFNYIETIFPWPYKNRDMVYRMEILNSEPDVTKIKLTGIPDHLPEKEGIVRMEKAEGFIVLEDKGVSTKLQYIFHSEPGGEVPAWLANSSIAELPFTTLTGLRKMLYRGQLD